MATLEDARRLALALPGTEEGTAWGMTVWKVGGKLFVWERPLRKKERAELGDAAPDGEILGVRVEHEGAKEVLLQSEPEKFFTTAHFDGSPIVLVKLDAVGVDELEELVVEAWLDRAPARLAQAYLAEHAG